MQGIISKSISIICSLTWDLLEQHKSEGFHSISIVLEYKKNKFILFEGINEKTTRTGQNSELPN